MTSLILAIASSLAFSLIFFIFKRAVPYREPLNKQNYSLPSLGLIYRKWELVAITLFVIIAPLIVYGIYLLLIFIKTMAIPRFADSPYVLAPFWAFWLVPAVFLGIIVSNIILEFILRRRLKEKFAEFEIYQNLKYGFNSNKVGRIIATVILFISAIYLSLAFDHYVVFGDSQIIIDEFLSFAENRYSYSDVESIKIESIFPSTRGVSSDTFYVIKFNDGNQWRTRFAPVEISTTPFKQIMNFVSKKSGLPIE